jgi:serine protease
MYRVFWQRMNNGEDQGVEVFALGLLPLASETVAALARFRTAERAFDSLDEAVKQAELQRGREDIIEESVEIIGPSPREGLAASRGDRGDEAVCPEDAGGLDDASGVFDHCQLYLEPASRGGLGIRPAWSAGACGRGVTLIDVEWGWDDHEDMPPLLPIWWPKASSTNMDHGVNVVGMLGAPHDKKGIKGIASKACYGVVQVDPKDPLTLFLGMLRAIAVLRPPGIILIEDQREVCRWFSDRNCAAKMPLEASWLGRHLARLAIRLGLYVVQAAGNAHQNLDLWMSRSFSDSGAIVVGAAEPWRNQRYIGNYGQRVDLSGWGKDVVTCGHLSTRGQNDLQWRRESRRCYTQSFGHTSAAAAMVAGCVALLAGQAVAKGRSIPPLEMRRILRETGHMTPPDIGPRPDLEKALKATRLE